MGLESLKTTQLPKNAEKYNQDLLNLAFHIKASGSNVKRRQIQIAKTDKNVNFGNFGKFETRSQLSSSGGARLLVTVQSKILLLLAAT